MAFTKITVVVTGERMQMNDFIEVSAVITHRIPWKGYAKQLVAHTHKYNQIKPLSYMYMKKTLELPSSTKIRV
jgi:hypothetical protein